MIRRTRPILFVLGPAGSGKSTLGRSLATAGFQHVELDRPPDEAGADRAAAALRPGLEVLAGSAKVGPLVVALESMDGRDASRGSVVTFNCVATLAPRHVAAIERAGIEIVVLYGTGAECIDGYLARERASGRAVPPTHWIEHNARSYAQLSLPHHAPHRVLSYRGGAFVGAEVLVRTVASHLARRNPQWRAIGETVGGDRDDQGGAVRRVHLARRPDSVPRR